MEKDLKKMNYFPMYISVQDPRSKIGGTFTSLQHFNKVIIHDEYAI